MLEAIAAGLSGFVLLGTLLPLWRAEVWWIRCWDFPRLQLSTLGLTAAVLDWAVLDLSGTWQQGALLASAACFLYQAARILPYTPFARHEVKWARRTAREQRLRILAANVLISNREPHRFLALIRDCDPDIVVALEGDRRWEKALDALEREHGYVHTIKRALDNAYGMHVYSRLPLERVAVEFLIEPDVPSMHAVVVLRSGQRVQAHFLHPAPPSPTENERSTERDAELVIVAKRAAKEQGPIIVTGDLNDVAWSTTTRLFRKLSRLLDPRIGRGMFNTFHAGWFFVRWPLDHIFHSDHFTLVEMRRLPSIGSDHFPILADLALEPERGPEQEAPRADADDRKLAKEKLEHAGKAPTASKDG